MSLRQKGFWSTGEPWVWLTGGALTLALLLVVGLIGLRSPAAAEPSSANGSRAWASSSGLG